MLVESQSDDHNDMSTPSEVQACFVMVSNVFYQQKTSPVHEHIVRVCLIRACMSSRQSEQPHILQISRQVTGANNVHPVFFVSSEVEDALNGSKYS